MQFSILFWNIWLENQLNGERRLAYLKREVDDLIKLYNPDMLALTEVLKRTDQDVAPILEHIASHGYTHQHFSSAVPYTQLWETGSALASKIKPSSIQEIDISKNTNASTMGFGDNYRKSLIDAQFLTEGNTAFNLVLAHPININAQNLIEHYRGIFKIGKLATSDKYLQNTIIGGDFNEPRFVPVSFRQIVGSAYDRATGSLLFPTWRLNASPETPIRANLDHVYWTRKGSLQMKSYEVIDNNASDHRPIYAEFVV